MIARFTKRLYFLQAFQSRSFTLIWIGQTVSFLISTGCLLAVRIPVSSKETILNLPGELLMVTEKGETRPGVRDFLADISEGITYVKSSRWIWVTILVASVGNVGFVASLSVAMPRLVHDVYSQGVWLLSLISAFSAVGSMIGAIGAGRAIRLQRRGLLANLSLVISSIGTIIFGLPFPGTEALIVAPFASILVGFGLAFFDAV